MIFYYFNQVRLNNLRVSIENELNPVTENLMHIHTNNIKIKEKYDLFNDNIQRITGRFTQIQDHSRQLDAIHEVLDKSFFEDNQKFGNLMTYSVLPFAQLSLAQANSLKKIQEDRNQIYQFLKDKLPKYKKLHQSFTHLFPINTTDKELSQDFQTRLNNYYTSLRKIGCHVVLFDKKSNTILNETTENIIPTQKKCSDISNSFWIETIQDKAYIFSCVKNNKIIDLPYEIIIGFERQETIDYHQSIDQKISELSSLLTDFESIKKEMASSGIMVSNDLNRQETVIKNSLRSLDRSFEEIGNYNQNMIKGLLLILICVFLIILVSSLVFASSITKPIHLAIKGLQKISDHVAAAIAEVSTFNLQVAKGASEQAAATEETSASLKETTMMVNQTARNAEQTNQLMEKNARSVEVIAKMTEKNADNATQANNLMNETSSSLENIASMIKKNADNADQANNLMKRANAAIEQASQAMMNLNQFMQKLAHIIEKTSSIIKTIESIAIKTNFLALNASMQANRAGKSGSGFAVVAREVRTLAVNTGKAARDTGDMIKDSVEGIKNGTMIVHKTNQDFKRLAKDTRELGRLFGEITTESKNQAQEIGLITQRAKSVNYLVKDIASASMEQAHEIMHINTDVKKIDELLADIAIASKEQALGIGYIEQAMVEMDKVTQQHVISADETAESTNEITGQMKEIKQLVNELVNMAGEDNSIFRHDMVLSFFEKGPITQSIDTIQKKFFMRFQS